MTNQRPTMSRRDFLRLASHLGSLLLVSPFLKACQRLGLIEPTATQTYTPENTPTASQTSTQTPTITSAPTATTTIGPTPTPAPGATLVSLVKTNDRVEGTRRAIELLGINPFSGKKVFVKPNFNSRDPAPASTHIDVLRTTILKLQEMNAAHITVGDRGGMGMATMVMESKGGFEMADELGIDFIDFVNLQTKDWVMINPPDNHWTTGDSPMGPGFPFARPLLKSDAIVSLCCMKTHMYGGITMSLKNAVGMVADLPGDVFYSYMQLLHEGGYMQDMIAEINLAYEPALIVLDGVDAFIRGGPARGDLAHPGVILAGTDRIAIDALGVVILKMNKCNLRKISQTFHLRNAIELGIGIDRPEKIHIITDDDESTRYAQKVHKRVMDQW